MAEQNQQQEESKGSKVQIPDVQEQVSAQAAAATTAEATEDARSENEGAEEEKVAVPKQIDQSKSNIPIQSDIDDLKELLQRNKQRLNLNANEIKLLESGIEKGTFKSVCNMIKVSLHKRKLYEEASRLDDMIPLFEPHRFWDNQPVPKPAETMGMEDEKYDKPIEVKTVEQAQSEPYGLLGDYHWCDLDMDDDHVVSEIYDLLLQNYVEDDDAMFRFDYSREFLKWALTPPGYEKKWLVGVRAGAKNKLYGCITGIPVNMNFNGTSVRCAEINFLCVHKKLRAKRLAPIMIREITRRVNRCDIWQAIYTAGATIPTPFCGTQYWHRSLNPQKLVDVGFSSRPANQTMARYIKLQKLNAVAIPDMRPMIDADVPQVTALLNTYLRSTTKVNIYFNEDEVRHLLVPQEKVIYSFCVDGADGKITDFFSFYCLPSQILQHAAYDTLWVAYSYYNVSTTGRLTEGMSDLLIKANEEKFDVFNALDLMENKTFLEELKFGAGDGLLHYYLYNWRIRHCEPQDIGIVLV